MAKVFRQYYRRPYFLPPMAEATEGNWFIVSSAQNKTLHVSFYWELLGAIALIHTSIVGVQAAGREQSHYRGWGGTGGFKPPSSRPVFVGSCLFACFQLQNIAQCCICFPFSPASHHLGNLASHPLFSRLPCTSRPLFSPSPTPLSLSRYT